MSRRALCCLFGLVLAIAGCASAGAPRSIAPDPGFSMAPSVGSAPSTGVASSLPASSGSASPGRSPTGWLAWQTEDGLALARRNGSERRILAPAGYHPDWSPDATSLAFVEDESDGTSDIWIEHRDGTGRRRFVDCHAPCQIAEDPAWSHDGTRLAYWTISDGQPQVIRVADVATSKVLLTVPPPTDLDGPIRPRWSPDDARLAVEMGHYVPDATNSANGGFRQVETRVGIITLTDAKPVMRLITMPELLAGYPDWSPTGDRLLIVAGSMTPFDRVGPTPNLYTLRADGSQPTQITARTADQPWIATPTWTSADHPIVVTLIDVHNTLAALDEDGANLVALSDVDGKPIGGAHPRLSTPTTP
jgi:dipeptidyl aminopeptidase/acylaminoacyl peptidase